MNDLRLSGVLSCSLVNGEGCRYVVFVQGCKHGCKGCHNPQTHALDGGYLKDIDELSREINFCLDNYPLDGVTLSGGDPYEQEDECISLLKKLHTCNVWIYTGYSTDQVKDRKLTKFADVVVTGPFVEELKCEGTYFGSSNQELFYPNSKV